MKNILLFLIFIGFILAISSCANVSENDLIDQMQGLLLVTYTNSVKSIIDNNCISCHDSPPVNGAPFSLVDYDAVKNNVGNIINRISRLEGESGLMPSGGPRLPQSLIDEVVQWQTDGLVE